jgi:primosomal protein N' (replication factor Y) (superfamily II helicase)
VYAQVLVFMPIRIRQSLLLDYEVPAQLREAVSPGMLVIVPLRNQILPGLVVSLSSISSVPDTRSIERLLDPEPVLNETLLRLAEWMAQETLAPLHRCAALMLPPGMRPSAYLQLTALVDHLPPDLPQGAANMLQLLLDRGVLSSAQIALALKGLDLRRARYYLQRKGFVKVERLLRLPGMKPKTVPLAQLAVPRSEWDKGLKGLKRTDLYLAALTFLEGESEPVDHSVLRAEIGVETHHIRMLESRGLVVTGRQEAIRDPLSDMVFTPDTPPQLTPGQESVWQELYALLTSRDAVPPVLLLGVTGSGKTELYMRAAAEVLKRRRQALILVPEISLTPQTVRRFAIRFLGQVGMWHSGMSAGERYDTWRRVRSGEIGVLVGARSALFAPFPNLGLIVMDEEEDTSYKNSWTPHYHTRETAARLAEMTGALFVMGSATPSLETYARAREGRYQLLKLPTRILSHRRRVLDWQRLLHLSRNRYTPLGGDDGPEQKLTPEALTIPLPPVQVVDMRAELKTGNRSVFSLSLQAAVEQALSRREQVILFMNRRGYATYVFCRDCGWVATCPRCDIPLTQHRMLASLVCHRCGYQDAAARACPSCKSGRVRAFGLGTEGLESRVAEQWPKARVLRWDRDTARGKGAHARIMGHFVRGDADILVGTQMVARGLDIPRVTVVGVVSADTALNLPDFRATERVFQLLAQVAGRSGRGILGGQVVFQTYHPHNYAVRFAAAHDYEGFAEHELQFRQTAAYPPALRLARLLTDHRDSLKAQRLAEDLAERLRKRLAAEGLPAEDLIGPAPAFFSRVRGRFRWQILLRHVAPPAFLRHFDLPPGWIVDIDPVDIL